MEHVPSRAAFVAEVATDLRHYCRGTLSAAHTGRLVRQAARIAQQKLHGRLRAAAHAEEARPADLALSVVGMAFCPPGPCSPLAAALEDVVDKDDTSLFLRFHAVVVRTATQELFHRWSDNDPLSARLWRNLHRLLRHNRRLLAFPPERPAWVAPASTSELRIDADPLTHEEAVGVLGDARTQYASLGEPVLALLEYAASRTDRRAAVSVEVLFSALRETLTRSLADELAAESPVRWENPDLILAIERAMDKVYRDVALRLGRYLAAGKLPPEVADGFKSALGDLLADCADGGPAQSYYDYLHTHRPELTKELYRTEFRAKFEYLADAVHQGFLDAMREQLASGESAPGGGGTY